VASADSIAAPSELRLPFAFGRIDPDIRREIVEHRAADGVPLTGILYQPPTAEPWTALLAMHPRGDFTRHYLAPGLARAGYAFFGTTTRYLNNDADALHERLLLDVAGSIAFLRSRRFERIVLCGNSGGGSLFGFYLEQAGRPASGRLDAAPSGDRVALGRFDLPGCDGLILLAAHLGEGEFLLSRLDPSVVDESEPAIVDPALDMYDPANGYRPLPAASRYESAFLDRFRAGQRARCARLDARAFEWADEARWYRAKMKSADFAAGDPSERYRTLRHGLTRRYMLIYRTLADPRYLDLTLDPSQRRPGSIFSYGRDPIAGNYGEGLARAMSVRGWLSTWSGLTSNADLRRTLAEVRVPTLIVNALADSDIYPSEAREIFATSGASDKHFAELPWADHYLNPVGEGAALADPRDRVLEIIEPWLRERFVP
jgi:pimeloyl-ACP methyl ester carboxylesterase